MAVKQKHLVNKYV